MSTAYVAPRIDDDCEPHDRLARQVAIGDATDTARALAEARREISYYEQENRRLASALHRSEVRFERCFELGLIGMAVTSSAKGYLDVNDHLCRILGYQREELLHMRWVDMTHPDDLARDLAEFDRVMSDEIDGYSLDKRWICKDGEIVDSIISVRCVRREDRSVDCFVALVQDVSERKRGAEALRSSQASRDADLAAMMRMQEVSTRMAQAGDPASLLQEIVDAAIAITCADMGCIQLLDRDLDSFRIVASSGFDRPFLDFFASVTDDVGACGAAMISGKRVVVEDVTTSPMFADEAALRAVLDAGVRAVQSTPLVNRSGLVVGMLSTHYRQPRQPRERDLRMLDMLARQAADWIERIHAEQALQEAEEERQALLASEREARAAAEQAARLKDEFLATISHELRTPIFNLLLWVDLMREGEFDATTFDEELNTIERTAKTQARLIDDLLDLSRIAAGKLSLVEELVELEAAIQLAIDVVMPRAQEKDVELRCSLVARPSTLRGDVTRLQQVFWNLLANAVKFTPAGGLVEIGLERVGSELVVTLRDTGQGIDPEFLPHVFDRFRQADGSAARAHAGLGLGLTIVKHLVELHGGSTRAESAGIGHGATFIVTLPAERDVTSPRDNGAARQARGPSLAGVRILFVEDDQVTRRLIARVLTDSGASVATASSVDEALERLSSASPDVLISDIGMPGKDGYALIREIRRSHRHVRLPAIALTAFARTADCERSLAAGFDRHLTKPVDACELRATVDGLLRERGIARLAHAET